MCFYISTIKISRNLENKKNNILYLEEASAFYYVWEIMYGKIEGR